MLGSYVTCVALIVAQSATHDTGHFGVLRAVERQVLKGHEDDQSKRIDQLQPAPA